MRCLHRVQLGQTRSQNLTSELSSPAIGCVSGSAASDGRKNAGLKSRISHSRRMHISWRRQTTAKIKTSVSMNCNDVALRYQRRRSRERSWKTLRGLTDGRKTLDDLRQPSAIEKLAFGHSMLLRGACVEAETSFAAATPSSIEWPNGNLPRALGETRTSVFFFHPRPARNIASIPSIAQTGGTSTLRF